MSTLAQRIDAGFELLEKDLGPGFAHKVNIPKLRFDSVMWDLLGQLYGSYSTGLQKLGLTDARGKVSYRLGAEHGFDTIDERQSYDSLRSAWVTKLNKAKK